MTEVRMGTNLTHQLLSMPSKMFNLRSSCREFTELKIWVKTNVLKITV